MATISINCHFALVLIWHGIWILECNNVGPSLDDDPSPYSYGHNHGPSHSHRHVRDCQPVVHGNVAHQTWPASNHTGVPAAESKVFISDVPGTTRWVTGDIAVVHDPLRTVSVLEPRGCGVNQREAVEETANVARCLYAQNGGFFGTSTGECLGNVVSDGVQVRDSRGEQNAQFGIRRDGTLFFGKELPVFYLSDEANPIVQLVSGVVWLLRDSQVYINQSIDADMTLWELAHFLKGQGVINAINLDGGGSSTYVANGSLTCYPSDHCVSDPMWCCPQRVSTILCVHHPVCPPSCVSTILCVHQPQCQPEDCSGHGMYIDGHCQCQEGWSGTGCDNLVCQLPACGAHGVCTQDGCACDAGWRGENCGQVCDLGFYGDGCTNGGLCDPVYGGCSCPIGFHGESCEQAGHCLANQMFATWREEETHKSKPYL